jgi:hypothetical protein
MRTVCLLFLICSVLFACKKNTGINQQPLPAHEKTPVPMLKDIVIPNLPSPYYHFEYNADSSISVASFASDFRRYDVVYAGGRINETTNNVGGLQEKVQYFYDTNGNVTDVDYLDLAGTVYTKIAFTYADGKLIKLERRRKRDTAFVVNKVMSFLYYQDDNLNEIIDHRPAVTGLQEESTTATWFGEYDNKVNVDGFSVIHNEFFDHLLLLPNVQFQKNNPKKELFSAAETAYQINYVYTYNERNLPITKHGDGMITAGATAGQSIQTNASYSYY